MKANTDNITIETLEAIIEELRHTPRMDQFVFFMLMLTSFDDIDSQIEYDFNLATSTHSISARDRPLALDITWTTAAEVANELTWFLNKLRTDAN